VLDPAVAENTKMLGREFKNAEQRRKLFHEKKFASSYEYDPDLVYTMSFFDNIINLKSYSVHMGNSLETDRWKKA
jgi:hypothetical protein